jgi:hypothetical protein
MAAAGPGFADEDCQAGSTWGVKEGCGGPTQYGLPMNTPPAPPLPVHPYSDINRPHQQAAPQYPYERRYDGQYERRYDGQYARPHEGQYARPYERRQLNPTRRDRDGDGVANRQDRYPDDPSRW